MPGFNEEEVVARSVQECHAAIEKNFTNFEIILINDCSSDSTGNEMEKAAIMYPEVSVHHNKIKGAMSDDTDLVVVERQDRRSYSPYRKVISVTNVMILKSLFRCPFGDYNFVQAYRRRVLEAIPIRTQAVSSVTPELIIRSYRANFSVKSIKLPYQQRKTGKSSIRVKHVTDSLINTIKLWWWLKSENRQNA